MPPPLPPLKEGEKCLAAVSNGDMAGTYLASGGVAPSDVGNGPAAAGWAVVLLQPPRVFSEAAAAPCHEEAVPSGSGVVDAV